MEKPGWPDEVSAVGASRRGQPWGNTGRYPPLPPMRPEPRGRPETGTTRRCGTHTQLRICRFDRGAECVQGRRDATTYAGRWGYPRRLRLRIRTQDDEEEVAAVLVMRDRDSK
jgi:hypothetical protein